MKRAMVLFLALAVLGRPALADDDDDTPGLDVPGQANRLNTELWRFAKKGSYAPVEKKLAALHEASRAEIPKDMVLPTGWRMAPAGHQLELGRYPLVVVPFAGNLVVLDNGYYVETNPEISVVSGDGMTVLKTLTTPSLFPCARVSPDGRLYVSGGYDQTIRGYDPGMEEVRDFTVNGFTSGLVPLDAKTLAVAYLLMDDSKGGYKSRGRLALVDTGTGEVKDELDCGRMPYALEWQDGKLWVTLLQDNAVVPYQVAAGRLKALAPIPVGAGPSALAADPARHRLYVVDQNSDEITVLDTLTGRKLATWSVRLGSSKFGAAPTSAAAAGGRLFVTLSRVNAVAVLDQATGRELGMIPTGWYPTDAVVDGKNLFTLSAKGIRPRRPNPNGPQPTKKREEPGYVLTLLKGSLGTVPLGDLEANLADWTKSVAEASPVYDPARGLKLPVKYVFYLVKENRTYDQVLGDLGIGNGDKDLCLFGKGVTPNHHQLASQFADLDNFYVDGEISVLGHSYTTSGYASPFLEWLGMDDYSGRLGTKDAKNPRKNEDFWPFGTVPFTFSPAYLWDALDAKGVDYRIYGEDYYFFCKPYRILTDKFGEDGALTRACYDRFMELSKDKARDWAFQELMKPFRGRNGTPGDCEKLLEDPGFLAKFSAFYCGDLGLAQAIAGDPAFKAQWAAFLYHCSLDFKGWDLAYSDLRRVGTWQADFRRQVAAGKVLPLQYIWLPNDHTAGMDPKSLNPNQLVAQNDAAVGVVLDTLSKSPVWKESLVVCIEDDSQNGPDHVDAMRSFCLAAGPTVKRGAVVGDLYDQLSLLKTLELILGLDPMNMNDALAAPMFSLFADQPDDRPYRTPPPSKYLTAEDRALYRDLLSGRDIQEPSREGANPKDVR